MVTVLEAPSDLPSYDSLPTHSGCLGLCIAHTSPFFELPPYVLLLKTRDYKHPNISISLPSYLRGRFPSQDIPSYIPDYAWLVLEDILNASAGRIDRICLFLHRKLLVTHRQGVLMRDANTFFDLACNIDLNVVLPSIMDSQFFLPHLLRFADGIIGSYSRFHHLQDFVSLAKICVQIGVLGRGEVDHFARSSLMIPGGGLLGVVPASVMLAVCAKVRALVVYVLCNGFKPTLPDHPYQARALSFFIERLSSYFVLRELDRLQSPAEWPRDQIFTGHILTTAEGDLLPGSYSHGTII